LKPKIDSRDSVAPSSRPPADRDPKEYGTRIQTQTGTSWDGYTEVEVTMEIADRMATLLEAQGIAVDILPTTVPEGYLADVFISLHCDGDGVGELSGFKLAHGSRRGPYEDRLMTAVTSAYADATGMAYDAEHVSRGMLGYYGFNWRASTNLAVRYQRSSSWVFLSMTTSTACRQAT
jgi:N-acetylmuramoyl-L-alanine amidase